MKIWSGWFLLILILGFNALCTEASIFDLRRHVTNFVRLLRGISAEETEKAIDERHSEPVMERNVFGHTGVPSPTISTNPVTAAPSVVTPVTDAPTTSAVTTAVPSTPIIVTLAPTPIQTGGISTLAPTSPATVVPSTSTPTLAGLVTLAPTTNANGSTTLAPSAAANSTTLSPTGIGNEEAITSYLEVNVSPGGQLRTAGTAQNNALNSVVQNFGSLDPADPASALILKNAYALNTIYHSCGGGLWFMNTNWNSAIPPCDVAMPWFGVTCDATGGVSNITLSGNDAVGNLPSEIRALTTLGKSKTALLSLSTLFGNTTMRVRMAHECTSFPSL